MKKVILILITSALIFSLISCKNTEEEKENEAEISNCASPIQCYSLDQFLTTLNLTQWDSGSAFFMASEYTYIPLTLSDDIKVYKVTVDDRYFIYEFVDKNDTKGITLLTVSISRPEAANKGYPKQTFDSVVSELKLTSENGYAYSERSNRWYVDLDYRYASVTDHTSSLIKSSSDISRFINFKKYQPNGNATKLLDFKNIRKYQVYSNISDEVLTITDEQKEDLFSIINSSEWEDFVIDGTPDMTLTFSFAYYTDGQIEMQYVASSGLFNNMSMGYHCYVSEVERLYINSLLGIE